jgi:hypothetical protein
MGWATFWVIFFTNSSGVTLRADDIKSRYLSNGLKKKQLSRVFHSLQKVLFLSIKEQLLIDPPKSAFTVRHWLTMMRIMMQEAKNVKRKKTFSWEAAGGIHSVEHILFAYTLVRVWVNSVFEIMNEFFITQRKICKQ